MGVDLRRFLTRVLFPDVNELELTYNLLVNIAPQHALTIFFLKKKIGPHLDKHIPQQQIEHEGKTPFQDISSKPYLLHRILLANIDFPQSETLKIEASHCLF